MITDPPVVLHTEPEMGLRGTNYEQKLNEAFEEMIGRLILSNEMEVDG